MELSKLQQYARLMDIVEKFHEIMKPIIEADKKNLKVMLTRQYKEYPNKDGRAFLYPPKNYRSTSLPRHKVLNPSEQQWNQYDGDVSGNHQQASQIYQSIPETVIGLILFAAEQIVQSKTESKDQEQLTNELERVVADGTDDNGNNDQSEHAIEPKHLTNGYDVLRQNDSRTQLQATVNGEANLEINITKIFPTVPLQNVSGSDGLEKNGCGTQLHATTNENGLLNYQAIDDTGNENNNEQAKDNRTGGKIRIIYYNPSQKRTKIEKELKKKEFQLSFKEQLKRKPENKLKRKEFQLNFEGLAKK
ncbi:MAG: hypothetical protein EZS28_029547, partial [Streblomastix strix]